MERTNIYSIISLLFFERELFENNYDIIFYEKWHEGKVRMNIIKIMEQRHSVRQYEDKKIEAKKRNILLKEIEAVNKESGLHIQIFFDEPKCFDSMMAHYGKFAGVHNYIALVGPKGADLDEKSGYYGEKLVLLAQSLGLNTCWVAMTHGKSAAEIGRGEKQVCLISLGYGKNQGAPHKNRLLSDVTKVSGAAPDWFKKGMDAVMLAPTAMNQQKFLFELNGDKVSAKVSGFGFYTKIDLGIVKYHFEAATGKNL